MQAMGRKVLPVLSSAIELVVKIISAAVLVPAIGYLGIAVTEPVIWCMCALSLAVFYVTIGHQKQSQTWCFFSVRTRRDLSQEKISALMAG